MAPLDLDFPLVGPFPFRFALVNILSTNLCACEGEC